MPAQDLTRARVKKRQPKAYKLPPVQVKQVLKPNLFSGERHAANVKERRAERALPVNKGRSYLPILVHPSHQQRMALIKVGTGIQQRHIAAANTGAQGWRSALHTAGVRHSDREMRQLLKIYQDPERRRYNREVVRALINGYEPSVAKPGTHKTKLQKLGAGFSHEAESRLINPAGLLGLIAEGGVQLGRATVEHPLKMGGSTAKSLPKLLEGIVTGTVAGAVHPGKVPAALKADYLHRYGQLAQGDYSGFRKTALKEGLAPYVLDAATLGVPAGRLPAAAARLSRLSRATKAGNKLGDVSRGTKFERYLTERRPQLRVAPNVYREQELSKNAFKIVGQRTTDRVRRLQMERRAAKRGAGTVPTHAVSALDLPVPKRFQKSQRLMHGDVAATRGRARLLYTADVARELGDARKNLRSLSKPERRAFRYTYELGLPHDNPALATKMLQARRDHIIRAREAHGKAGNPVTASTHDELKDINWLLDNPHAITEKVRQVATIEAERAKRLGARDPGLDDVRAELRRLGPVARTLGMRRGEKTVAPAPLKGGKAKLKAVPDAPVSEVDRFNGIIAELEPKLEKERAALAKSQTYARLNNVTHLENQIKSFKVRRDRAAKAEAAGQEAQTVTQGWQVTRVKGEGATHQLGDTELRVTERTIKPKGKPKATAEDARVADLRARLEKTHSERLKQQLYTQLERAEEEAKAAKPKVTELKTAKARKVFDVYKGDEKVGSYATLRDAKNEAVNRHVGSIKKQKKVPEMKYEQESDADYLARVQKTIKDMGLHEPGYYHHRGVTEEVPKFARQLGPGAHTINEPHATGWKLFDTGTSSNDAQLIHLHGLGQNLKRAHQWNFVSENFRRYTYPGSDKLKTPEALDAFLSENAMDPHDVVLWNPGKFARERQLAGEGTTAEQMGQAIRNSTANIDDFRTHPEDFKSLRGWAVVPKAVHDEMTASFGNRATPASIWMSRLLKGWPSKVILGTNPSWSAIQVANNVYLSALAGLHPGTWIKAAVWRRKNPDLAQHMNAYLGISPAGAEHLTQSPVNELREGSFAFGHGRIAQAFARHNPLDTLFKIDRLNNNFFRGAAGYRELQRAVWRQMGQDVHELHGIQQRLKSLWVMPPRHQVEQLIESAPVMEEMGRKVDDLLGNYTRYSAAERAILERNVMFYGFLRFSVRYAFYTLPFKHPIIASIQEKLARMNEDETRKLLGLNADDQLPRGVLATLFYMHKGHLTALPLQRANPAANPLTQAIGTEGGAEALFGAIPPVIAVAINAMAKKNIYFDRDYKLGTDPKAPGEPGSASMDIGWGKRAEIAGEELAQLAFPYRAGEAIQRGERPTGSDSHLFDMHYTQYSPTGQIAPGLAREQKTYLDQGTLNRVLQQLVGMYPRVSFEKEIAQRLKEKRQQAYNKAHHISKGRSSAPAGSFNLGGSNSSINLGGGGGGISLP